MSDSGKYEYALSDERIQEIFDEYVKPLTKLLAAQARYFNAE